MLVHWPGGARIEEISSGSVPVPVEYLQAHDEWVLVLQGGAVLSVGDRRFGLGAGDWLLLPGAIPHRLEHVEPGTRWLAVHGPPAGEPPTRSAGTGAASGGDPPASGPGAPG